MSDIDPQPQPHPSETFPNAVPVPDVPVSTTLSRRHLLMGAGLLAVAGAAYARSPRAQYPSISDEKFDAMFPTKFGDWQTVPASELILPPEGGLQAKLYQHILTRTYTNSNGDAIMFLIAYNSEQVNNVQVHRPEICYGASGFKIQDSRPYDLPLGSGKSVPARIVRAERPTRTENIVYWTRIGDEFPQTWLGQRISMTKANLKGFYADGMLVRTSVIMDDEQKSVELISRFLRDLAAACPPPARKLAFRIA